MCSSTFYALEQDQNTFIPLVIILSNIFISGIIDIKLLLKLVLLFLKESKQQVETVLEGLKSVLEKDDGEEIKLKKELIEEKHHLEKYESAVKENHQKLKHWKKEVS
jgi:hypothetical protein